MIFRFVAEYSKSSDLRREFAQDPNGVLDRYEISQAERQPLITGDRQLVARQLHAEIDDMLAGAYYAILWPMYYPNILSSIEQPSGLQGEAFEIAIPALNIAPQVKVRFRLGAQQVDATILRIDHSPQSRVHTLHCQAVFPESGAWDVEVINLVEGEERSDSRKSYLSISGDQSHDLSNAISAACAVVPFRETRCSDGAGQDRPVFERISGDRLVGGVRAASGDGQGPGGSARVLGWPGRPAEALAGSRAERALAERTVAAAAA